MKVFVFYFTAKIVYLIPICIHSLVGPSAFTTHHVLRSSALPSGFLLTFLSVYMCICEFVWKCMWGADTLASGFSYFLRIPQVLLKRERRRVIERKTTNRARGKYRGDEFGSRWGQRAETSHTTTTITRSRTDTPFRCLLYEFTLGIDCDIWKLCSHLSNMYTINNLYPTLKERLLGFECLYLYLYFLFFSIWGPKCEKCCCTVLRFISGLICL